MRHLPRGNACLAVKPSADPGLRLWEASFRFRMSFRHHLADRAGAETLLAEVRLGDAVGWSQALPRAYLSGESLDGVQADAVALWRDIVPLPLGAAPDLASVLELIRPVWERADARRCPAAFALVEIAVADAAARRLGVPLRLPGGDGRGLPLVGVIPATGRRAAAWLTRALGLLGYRRFKVKLGDDRAADAARLGAVRAAAGPGAWLAADANQAWSEAELLARAGELRRHGVSLLEEPLTRPAAAACDFPALERELGIALMADESLCTMADARGVLERGGPSWWNLRVAKNGGFSGVAALAALAREHGVRVYGGVLVGETAQLAAAGRAALAGAGAECLEYGFPRVLLRGDPFRGGPGGFSGRAGPLPDRIGLGTTLRRERLARVARPLAADGV